MILIFLMLILVSCLVLNVSLIWVGFEEEESIIGWPAIINLFPTTLALILLSNLSVLP